MGMNETPSANRIHIGLFGRRNAGKSSLINAMTGQDLAIVSNIKGTTTDPVQKAMELLPLGPVVLIDTPGLDDTGELGAARVRKAYQTMHKTDLAILVIDGAQHPDETTLRETEQPGGIESAEDSLCDCRQQIGIADRGRKTKDRFLFSKTCRGFVCQR